ncbi:MAG TPA: hypothetical protein VLS90_09120 [Thermodesulfobacteriota bacterium]|nr:hypothetical protein [Thermodesulfobacteriota bacterium]
MARMEITRADMESLRDILQRYLSELTMELAHSERKDFRDFLRKRREFMEAFIRRLDEELTAGKRRMDSAAKAGEVEILRNMGVEEYCPLF